MRQPRDRVYGNLVRCEPAQEIGSARGAARGTRRRCRRGRGAQGEQPEERPSVEVGGVRRSGRFADGPGLAACAGQPAPGRWHHGVQGPAEGVARLPRGDQRVGLLVRALPERVPGLPARRGPVRAQGGVHRSRQPRRQRRGRGVPTPLPGRLPELRGSAAADRGYLEAVGGIPQTVYIDRQGKQVFDHAGPYETVGALETDIRRYVLQ